MSPLPTAQPAFPQPWESQVEAPASPISLLAQKQSAARESWVDQSFTVLAAIGLVLFALASNLCAIMDLCCGGLMINGQLVTSPLAMFQLERNYLMGVYAGTSLLTIVCAIALTRYDLPRWAMVVKFVPLVFAVVFIGVVLRKSGPIARKIAYFYLLAGSMLAGLAIMYFMKIGFQLDTYDWYPILYSVCLQSGLTLAIASAMSIDN